MHIPSFNIQQAKQQVFLYKLELQLDHLWLNLWCCVMAFAPFFIVLRLRLVGSKFLPTKTVQYFFLKLP
jgi:hypothetical protein